jgi:hypothetical protein
MLESATDYLHLVVMMVFYVGWFALTCTSPYFFFESEALSLL